MTTDLMPFDYEGQTVRTVVIDGEPWFVLSDLARILGLSQFRKDRLDEGVIRNHTLPTAGGAQQMTIVSEPGMYEVVIRSDKPEAVAFRRWITTDVLPTIRKTGGYGRIDGASLTRLELIQIAMNAETERLALEAENKELTPKADAYDSFMDSTGFYSVGSVAKMLGRSQNWLFRELRNRGVLIAKGAMRNTPYQQYMRHFVVKAHDYARSNGEYGSSYTTYVQPSGIDFIRRKLGLLAIDPVLTVSS